MFRVSATLRLAIGLAFLGISVYLASRTIGLGQDEWMVASRGRAALSEAIALHTSSLVVHGDFKHLQEVFQILVKRNHDIISIGLRDSDKTLLTEAGNHEQNWRTEEKIADGKIFVPIAVGDRNYGNVEINFRPLRNYGINGFLQSRAFAQFAFVLSAGTLLFSFYLRNMLSHLDPSKVIPERVRAALDTFAEGLLVLDKTSRIVLANKAFTETIGETNVDLQGRRVTELPWRSKDGAMPWAEALADGKARTGRMLDLELTNQRKITYMINASPIFSEKGELQGVLASFDDVTLHEQRKQELEQTLMVLGESREQIRQQNDELRILATRDPLTGCMNRRSFFEAIEKAWDDCSMSGTSIACIMVDVDHFKQVNDNHGHATGDEVLRCVGKTLVELEDIGALPCRYGGEEFCITLEGYSLEMAREFAEEIRTVIEAQRPADIEITASLGVSIVEDFTMPFEEILERADQGLYVAKRRGRNQVICWNDFDIEELNEADPSEKAPLQASQPVRSGIPFHAVTALISALTYRDASTAEHSRRVADLCVQVASKLVSVREQYVIETAALLHDIGKIGTPDAVLLKPGPLDAEERDVMSHHDVIGLEIVKTTFENQELAAIVANHFAWYGGHPRIPNLPTHKDIPLGARILAIADTFDAIVNDRVYRKAASKQEAFHELRRCAGKQFDPSLVELFIQTVIDSDLTQPSAFSPGLTKRAALNIGLIMECMTQALEDGNTQEVRDQARLLAVVATETKLEEIAAIAKELHANATDDTETEELLQVATTLIDLCRMTQRAYLGVGEESRRRREEMARRQFADQPQRQN